MVKRVQLNLDPQRDADIFQWLQQHSNRSEAIRNAIRRTMHPPRALDESTLRRVIREELKGAVAVPVADEDREEDIDTVAGAQLDAMF